MDIVCRLAQRRVAQRPQRRLDRRHLNTQLLELREAITECGKLALLHSNLLVLVRQQRSRLCFVPPHDRVQTLNGCERDAMQVGADDRLVVVAEAERGMKVLRRRADARMLFLSWASA